MMDNCCPLRLDEPITLLDTAAPLLQCDKDFLKSSMFSSDGKTVLASTESKQALIYRIDGAIIEKYQYYESPSRNSDTLDDDVIGNSSCNNACPMICCLEKSIPMGESIYDLKWTYNNMSSTSQRFLATCSDHPIQLWDVDSSSVECSYNAYDHVDELDTAICLALNASSDRVYGGYNRMIRAFDLEYPGKRCVQEMPTTESRRSPHGQKGIVSALAFNPDYSGMYAAGSFAHSVGIYAENNPHPIILLDVDCGVTCLRWSPCGRYLWVGGRNCSSIACWDIRSTQTVLGDVRRTCRTNQRMTFDLDPWGRYLCTGDQDGDLLLYDAASFALVRSWSPPNSPSRGAAPVCVNSAMFHPYSAIIGAAVGERSFPTLSSDSSDSDESVSRAPVSREAHIAINSQCMKQRRTVGSTSTLFLLGMHRTPIAFPT